MTRSQAKHRIRGPFGGSTLLAACAALICGGLFWGEVYAQDQKVPQDTASDLARQNFDRVAASADQIKVVLHKDPGLMVELKRWVAKDATDHGQLVADSDLTDRAIYDRLEIDIEFRSVATMLVQKYGYLLPQINPESPQAKEQELLIEDRARWLAQDEEQELEQARQGSANNLERARTCDPRQNEDCRQQNPAYPTEEEQQEIGTPALPQRNVPPSTPNAPASPTRNGSPIEQAQLVEPGIDGSPSSADPFSLVGSLDSLSATPSPMLSLISQAGPGTLVGSSLSSSRQDQGLNLQVPTDGTLFPGAQPNSSADFNRSRPTVDSTNPPMDRSGAPPTTDGIREQSESGRREYEREDGMVRQGNLYKPRSEINMSQAMLRQPIPYVDVPSLYDMYLQALPQPPAPKRFGMEVFENGTRDKQLIPFDLPVGPDYVVGPGDSLAIDLWGGVSQRILRTVDREGKLSLPEAGPLLVAGKSLSDVQESVQKSLRSQFRDVSADVSLARLRTIRVYVVGDVTRPGAYDVSSLSTPLNALFAAGGPTTRGSLRIVEHNRGNQLVQNVDLYDLLLHGVRADIERLENGDTVLVPPIGREISVEGMVRRPAIYELGEEKSLSDVLTLAGGLLPTATLRHIEVERVVAHDKRTMLSLDISPDTDPASIAKQLDSLKVEDGDKVRVFPIAPYNQDTLYLEGHVMRPGRYSYRPGMRVTDLIASYKDLLPEPAGQYAEIIRLNAPDYRPTVESFNLADALSHPASAPLLEALDTVQIFGRYDFENPPTVSVWGDVRTPGTYRTSGQIHLSDAVHMAGGLAPDAEQEDAQVFRYLPDGQMKIFSVKLAAALAGDPTDNIMLDSRDRVLVHRNASDVEPATVYVEGEVARPGRYPLTTNMTVADLIHVAGGPKQSADLKNADLTHYDWNSQSRMMGQHQEIELADALAGATDTSPTLHNGDVLTVRKLPGWDDLGASLTVRGEVVHAGSYGIRPGERLSSIIQRAGGFMPDAYPYGAILIRTEVQQLEDRSQAELVERVREQQTTLKLASKTEQDPEAKQSDETAYEQWQSTLDRLTSNPPVGRVTIQISTKLKSWEGTPRDIAVRAGDRLIIPKKPSYVMVEGQVFNPTAVAFRPGKSAKWYLSQAGGPTNLANKRAIFVIRADGTVIGHGSTLFLGNNLGESLEPGDTVVVPEKVLGGSPTWKALFQTAQVSTSIVTSIFLAAKY
jgi:polysaccharide biosynthesis/export protein